MTTITFDTLEFANTLKAGGFTQEQAETEARALAKIFEPNTKELATKADIHQLKSDIREMELRLIIKLGSMIVLALAALTAFSKWIG